LDCAKKLKDSFAKVGAYSSEQKFIRGDPEGIIEWIGEEAEAFDEIFSNRSDFCAFAGARGCNTPGVYIPLDNEYVFKLVISVDKTDAKF
jgi:hypothetical protein